MKKAIEDKKFQAEVERDESLNFLLRDTISLTMLGGSGQTNVIPPEAWANLDVRILPGGDPKAVLETLLEKSAPASALPGCNNTTTIRITHDRMNSP